jgi:GWxTD domain-containing protein
MRMIRFAAPVALAAVSTLIAVPRSALGQEFDLREIFSNDRFYEDHQILRARGEVGFLADTWLLPGTADSVQVLVGVSLSNSSLQFVQTTEGLWQANYQVRAEFAPEDGDAEKLERSWDKSVEVETFDETMLESETIVFQTEVAMVPGTYGFSVTVRDLNANDASRASRTLEITPFPSVGAVSEPVLLRLYQTTDTGVSYVVSPSHYYPSAPTRFDFMIDLAHVDQGGPYTARAQLIPEDESSGRASSDWSQAVVSQDDGTAKVFGSLENNDARFGEFRFEIELINGAGEVLVNRSTPLIIAGSGGWIVENWDDALSLLKYAATSDELDILEDVEGAEARVEAWNCFWRIRDPIPATAVNEELQDYFRRIAIANREWKSALRPGYLSDRGRVYMTLGSPDEISRNPVPSGAEAFEIWLYYRHNFQIVFVDRIGFNNYQLENISVYQRELSFLERRKRTFLKERSQECPLLAPAHE